MLCLHVCVCVCVIEEHESLRAERGREIHRGGVSYIREHRWSERRGRYTETPEGGGWRRAAACHIRVDPVKRECLRCPSPVVCPAFDRVWRPRPTPTCGQQPAERACVEAGVVVGWWGSDTRNYSFLHMSFKTLKPSD